MNKATWFPGPMLLIVMTLCFGSGYAQPPGVNCANSTLIPAAPFVWNGVTDNGIQECASGPYRDLFYHFSAWHTAVYHISLCNSGGIKMRVWHNGVCCVGTNYTNVMNTCGSNADIYLPLTSGDVTYIEFGDIIPSGGPRPWVFELTEVPFTPCLGMMQLPQDDIAFPATRIGDTSFIQVPVVNAGSDNLCISGITSNGSAWLVAESLTVAPNSQGLLQVAFAPAFAHDYLGTIELVTSDPAHALDSILVEGTGCRPVQPPPPPRLLEANSPTAVYYQPPWVQANPEQEYAIEVWESPLGVVEYADYPHGLTNAPVWATASQWGIGGSGMLDGLSPETQYQIRFVARDCTGQQLSGPPAFHATGPDIVLAPSDLVIKAVDSTLLELNWKACSDTSGRRVTHRGYFVYRSDNPDSNEIPIEIVPLHLMSINPLPYGSRQFFWIEPHAQNSWYGAQPFISWPPDGCTLAGEQDIILKDPLHYEAEWDSFRIEGDSAGFPVLLGSSWDNNTDLIGELGTRVDFNDLGNGPHVITAVVVDDSGHSHLSSILVNVVDAPSCTFTASYDPGPRTFHVSQLAPVIPAGYSSAGTLWLCSHVGERYGPTIDLTWNPEFDSLMIVKPLPQVTEGLLYEPNYWFQNPHENAGLQPQTVQTPVTLNRIKCCCVDMTLKTAGQADGKYEGWNGQLGAIVNCNARAKTFEVGFGFEVQRTLRYEVSETEEACTWGQDAKGTRYFDTGVCKNETCTITKQDTIFKWHRGNRYAYDTSTTGGFGNDGYGKKGVGRTDGRNRGPRDERGMPGRDKVKKTGKAEGKISGYDRPADVGTLQNKQCVHDHAQNRFFARTDPPCNIAMPCCLMWDIEWDVTFCMGQNSCSVTQTIPPTLTMVPTPEGCPSLAGD